MSKWEHHGSIDFFKKKPDNGGEIWGWVIAVVIFIAIIA